ncbi:MULTISPECIES: hypothetical protein [unclassified Streptosporangium]|uniref:hypothetical protein n=1 Tax=unclassified Streptosporangium TaxID=2632669 RepID=UPI002E2C5B12|nr:MULTISPECIES: hypothetical protein [unclassified Streptosporangium]
MTTPTHDGHLAQLAAGDVARLGASVDTPKPVPPRAPAGDVDPEVRRAMGAAALAFPGRRAPGYARLQEALGHWTPTTAWWPWPAAVSPQVSSSQ